MQVQLVFWLQKAGGFQASVKVSLILTFLFPIGDFSGRAHTIQGRAIATELHVSLVADSERRDACITCDARLQHPAFAQFDDGQGFGLINGSG